MSCSADRQALGKITAEGVFLEELERDPAHYLPEVTDEHLDTSTATSSRIDLEPADGRDPRRAVEVPGQDPAVAERARWSWPATSPTPRSRSGSTPARRCPQYLRDHGVYYAGPAKTPEGYASGSFGPTTAGRMDAYVDQFQAAGGSLVMLAKGNRSQQVTDACKRHGGFYLGSIGGPAARLAKDCINKVEVLEYPELGMEAVWKIDVVDFPAFIVVDDKGNDFFADVSKPVRLRAKA